MTEANSKKPQSGALTAPQTYKSALSKAQDIYTNSLIASMQDINLSLSNYQKTCAYNEVAVMQQLAEKEEIAISSMPMNNIIKILQQVTMLSVNPAAVPAECYTIMRNVKFKETWHKEFEFGLQGDGFDKIVRTFGVNVKMIHPCWLVREGDGFTYSSFSGLQITPPTWSPKGGSGTVVRVVYPIEYNDGSVQFHICEREEVSKNLKAHINNNLMKSKDQPNKTAIKDKIENMTLDQMFKDPDALAIMSPAWREPHSRESMIIRKMRKNIMTKIPCDFSNAMVSLAFKDVEADDEYDPQRDERINPEEALEVEVSEKTATEPIPEPVALIDPDTGELLQEQPKVAPEPQKRATAGKAPSKTAPF